MNWMDEGLLTPNNDLFGRNYDATHLFVYLTERTSWRTIRDIWLKYQTVGAEEALKLTVEMTLGGTFMNFLRNWHTANYAKDLAHAPAKYDYAEDEVTKIDCTGAQWGPLTSTAVTTVQYTAPFTVTSSVGRYGAEYVVFEAPTNPENLRIEINGGADFSYRIISIRDNTYLKVYDGDTNPYKFTRPRRTGKWTKFAVLVVGGSSGGSYNLTLYEPVVVTHAESDSGYQWYHHNGKLGSKCYKNKSAGADDTYATPLTLPVQRAASCDSNARSDTTVQETEPNQITVDFSAFAHSLYTSHPTDPLNRSSEAGHETEGLIPSGTYSVELNPVVSYPWLSTQYVAVAFTLSVPGSPDPYRTIGCTDMYPHSSLCSFHITEDVTIPAHETHRWKFVVIGVTGFDNGNPETIEISGRALSIKRK
jgi:hypothetical protein